MEFKRQIINAHFVRFHFQVLGQRAERRQRAERHFQISFHTLF